MSVRGFRDSFGRYVPWWLSNRLGKNVAFRFLYSMIMPLDVLMEGILQGVQAAWPGKGTPTALPLIGRSRGLLRGEAETDDAYIARLIAWLDTWKDAAATELAAMAIHLYLANAPMVRIVDRSGNWVTVASDGSITRATAAWDWDSISNPERVGFWSDLWIIVYPCEWTIPGSTLSALDLLWGTHDVGTGHEVSREAVQSILGLVAQWKGAHTYVRAIIWSYDASLFDPASPVAGDPDGLWGRWGKLSGGHQVPARNTTCRYWLPQDG